MNVFTMRNVSIASLLVLLPPANEVCEGYVLQVSVCPHRGGGACMVLFGGACVVLFWGYAWFYSGGVHGFIWGASGFIRGACVVLFGGACVVLFGGHAWFYLGGMCGFIQGACVVLFGGGMHGFFSFFGYNEIRSISGRYASYWNAFLFVQRIYASGADVINCAGCFAQKWNWASWQCEVHCDVKVSKYGKWWVS